MFYRINKGLQIVFCLLLAIASCAQKGIIVKKENNTGPKLDTLEINPAERFALVIGNEKYEEGSLKNPVNDARGMAALLKKYGFKVTLKTDLDENHMDRAIEDFGDSVSKRRGIGLFYYSGHGLQHNSENFLLPLGSALEKEEDIKKETVQLDKILEKISYSKNGLNIVILDACRNSPYYNTLKNIPRGLTYSLNKTRNTLIFYSTSANEVAEDGEGQNSPFTEALIDVINRSDSIELLQIAKQVIWEVEKKTKERQTPQFVATMKNDFFFKKQVGQRSPKLFVLSIGISKYRDSSYSLKYGSKGARDFAEAFKKNSAIPYEASNAYSLEDGDATRMNIYMLINRFRQSALPGDLILVYYNGHIAADWSGFSLMPYDADFKDPDNTGISQEILLSILSKLPCKTLLFLDGAAAIATGEKNTLLETLSQPRNNVIVLSACSKDGSILAFESAKYEGNLFTTTILMGLKEAGSKENPGFIDVESLADYVIKKTETLSMGRQIPVIYYPKGWQNFIIAKKME